MLAASFQLIVKRALAHWRLLTAVVVGVLLAVTIMATSSVYFDSLRELGLRRTLADYEDTQLDLLVDASVRPVDDGSHGSITAVIDNRVVLPLARHLNSKDLAIRTWTFFFDDPPAMVRADQCPCVHRPQLQQDDGSYPIIECDCRRISFSAVPRQDDRLTVIRGRAPEPVTRQPAADEVLTIEAIMPVETTEMFDLDIGSVVKARPYWEDEHQQLQAVITGVYERTDEDDPVWRIWRESFRYQGTTLEFADFVVPEETLRLALGGYFPSMGAEYAWLLDTEASSIRPSDTPRIRGAVDHFVGELRANVDGFRFRSQLTDALERFEIELFFNRLPVFIILILIVLVVLYYVSTLGSMLVEAQKPEIALLRSRGATSFQILAVFVVEAALLSAGAFVIGPFLALVGVSAIGIIPGFAELNGGDLLPVRLTTDVYRLAGLGAGLTLLALMVPAVRASRLGMLRERRSRARPGRLAVIQRYYLDVGFLGIVIFLFWQLTKQGSFVATRLFGETTVNQLILAVPAIFLLAAALVLLRVFPLLLDLLGRLLASRYASRLTPPAVVLGVWQMSRNPAHYMQLGLLIILGAALGVFASTFASSLERSAMDQAMYESGADLRITSFSIPAGGQSRSVEGILEDVEGVDTVATVRRQRSFPSGGLNFATFNLLAVEVEDFAKVAFEREDFLDGTLSESVSKLEVDDPPPIELPEGTRWLSARVRVPISRPDVRVLARISDSNDRYYYTNLGRLNPQSDAPAFTCTDEELQSNGGWCRIGGSIMPSNRRPMAPEPPLYLHYIGLTSYEGLLPGQIFIDDITAHVGLTSQETVIEDFDSVEGWHELRPGRNSLGDTISAAVDSNGDPLAGIARFRWTQGGRDEARGFSSVSYGPLPALGTQSLLDAYGASIGDTLQMSTQSTRFEAQIVEVIDYIPTMYPNDDPFMIVSAEALHRRVNVSTAFIERNPNEYWISLSGPAQVDEETIEAALEPTRGRFRDVVVRSDELHRATIDPLVSAGWKALLSLAFLTVLIVAALGFLVHSRISFDSRRGEFATLRSIGLSIRQVTSLVLIEQLLVIGVAVGFGIFLGLRVGAVVMPYLANTSESGLVTPPMILEVEWAGFGVTFGLFFLVFAAVLGALVISVHRTAIHAVMRSGE